MYTYEDAERYITENGTIAVPAETLEAQIAFRLRVAAENDGEYRSPAQRNADMVRTWETQHAREENTADTAR